MPGKLDRLIKTRERQRQALELRKAGASYDQIARQLGYSNESGAYKAIQTVLQATVQEPSDEMRTLELKRLDQMLIGLWPDAQRGHQGAVDRALKIMERRAAYLGLDAPKRSELSGPDGGPIEVDQVNVVTLSDEERDARIFAVVERARTRTGGPALPSQPHLAPEQGATNGSLAH